MRLCDDDAIIGFEVRLMGEAPKAAPGVNHAVGCVLAGISGALAGLAGMFKVRPSGQITIDFNSGYGFTTIIVAFLGRLHPIGILLAGLLMALTYIGGELAQLMLVYLGHPSNCFGDAAVVPIGNGHLYQLSHSHRGKIMDLVGINPVLLIASLMVSRQSSLPRLVKLSLKNLAS